MMANEGLHRPVGIAARFGVGLLRLSGLCALMALGALATTGPALAGNVTYTGQGFNYDGTTHNLNDERCGADGQTPADDGSTGLFANWNGPGQPYQTGQGYLVWVLSGSASQQGVQLNLPSPDGTVDMIQVGGTWKYASQYYSYDDLVNFPVSAGPAGTRAQLVVSHGCQPFEGDKGAWCSPGYWKNAADAAWDLTTYVKTDLFNLTVVPDFYDTPTTKLPPYGPTLIQALDNTGMGGANKYGAASAPYGLNAFNATGAFLTDNIPGYDFDPARVDESDETACPIDNHGVFKTPQ
jgi:hypothetical protein